MNKNFPRLIISATQSGSGKTTITTGLLGGRFKSGGTVDALNVSTIVTSSPRPALKAAEQLSRSTFQQP